MGRLPGADGGKHRLFRCARARSAGGSTGIAGSRASAILHPAHVVAPHHMPAHHMVAVPPVGPAVGARVASDDAVMPPSMMSAVGSAVGSGTGGDRREQQRATEERGGKQADHRIPHSRR